LPGNIHTIPTDSVVNVLKSCYSVAEIHFLLHCTNVPVWLSFLSTPPFPWNDFGHNLSLTQKMPSLSFTKCVLRNIVILRSNYAQSAIHRQASHDHGVNAWGPFLISPLGANFGPQGRSCPLEGKLSPGCEVLCSPLHSSKQ
jgi:hypothetical protein